MQMLLTFTNFGVLAQSGPEANRQSIPSQKTRFPDRWMTSSVGLCEKAMPVCLSGCESHTHNTHQERKTRNNKKQKR